MELQVVEMGEPARLPCQVLSAGSGWAIGTAPKSGILIVLNDLEKQSGGVLVSEDELLEVGYSRE